MDEREWLAWDERKLCWAMHNARVEAEAERLKLAARIARRDSRRRDLTLMVVLPLLLALLVRQSPGHPETMIALALLGVCALRSGPVATPVTRSSE